MLPHSGHLSQVSWRENREWETRALQGIDYCTACDDEKAAHRGNLVWSDDEKGGEFGSSVEDEVLMKGVSMRTEGFPWNRGQSEGWISGADGGS